MKAIDNSPTIDTFPTSIGQKRCWFMEQMHPGNKGLNLAIRWELLGPVKSEFVDAALRKIIARHEILRTIFIERDGEPMQEVVAKSDFKLDFVDVQTLNAADQSERIAAIAIEHAEQPFDMGKPNLLRVTMVRTAAQRAELLIAVHNSIFDGFSIGVLGHELGIHLEAMLANKEPELPELVLQYGDYAQWLEDYEKSGALKAEETYWSDTLREMPYYELPMDRPRAAQTPVAAVCATSFPADFEQKLAEVAKKLGTSVFALGTAAFSVALGRFSGKENVSFAVQAAGRLDTDLEPLIGIFTNPLVMRFDMNNEASLQEHATLARDVVNGALAHQTLPFDKVVQVLNPPRDPLRIPLVSIMFNLQKAFLKERKYGDLELGSIQSHSPATLYDLNVHIIGRNSGWGMVIDYNANLFDAETIRSFSDLLLDTFSKIVTDPESLISDIPVRTKVAQQQTQPVAARMAPAANFAGIDTLRTIWADVLALPEDQIKGSFFDLGGHSVLALRMLAQVGNAFDERPNLYAFLGDPTLEGLAGLLGEPIVAADVAPDVAQNTSTQGQMWELVELRTGPDTGPVLLTINQPFMYHALAQQMTSGCVVANIGVPGQDALDKVRSDGFDAAVAQAADMVQDKYAGRPLIMCGLCVDGRVALGLAHALREKGKQVAVIGMIDTWAPGAVKEFSSFARKRDKWRIRMRRLGYYFGLRAKGEITWRDLLAQNSAAAKLMTALRLRAGKSETAALVDDTVDCFVEQTRGYDFAPYSGEVVLFVTRSQGVLPRDGVLGWSHKLARDVAVYPVNGWHGDALTRSGFERVIGVLDDKISRLTAPPKS